MTKIPNVTVRDLKLEVLTKFAHEDWKFPSTKNPKLESVVKSLRTNAVRVRFLILLPTQIAGAMAITQRAQDLAEYDLTGALSRERLPSDVSSKVDNHRTEILRAYEDEQRKKQGTPGWDKESGEFHMDAARSLLGLAEIPLGAMMLIQTLPPQIIGAWTTIETMLGDLWESALNAHPKTLAALNGKPKRDSNTRLPKNCSTDQESKGIDLNLVAMNDFDLRTSMGTLACTRFCGHPLKLIQPSARTP